VRLRVVQVSTETIETTRVQRVSNRLEASVYYLDERTLHLWMLAVLFFGIGDVILTSIGLSLTGVVEAGPLAGPMLREFGFGTMYLLKGGLFGFTLLMWRLTPDPEAVGIPLGLSVLGILVCIWNTLIILYAQGML